MARKKTEAKCGTRAYHAGGPETALGAIAKLIPYAGENTAAVVKRGIEGPYGTHCDGIDGMPCGRRKPSTACGEGLGEADGLR